MQVHDVRARTKSSPPRLREGGLAAGRGWAGESGAGSNHPGLACASAAPLIQGRDFCRAVGTAQVLEAAPPRHLLRLNSNNESIFGKQAQSVIWILLL